MRLNLLATKSSHSVSQFLLFNSFSSRKLFTFPRTPISPSTPLFHSKSRQSRFVPICSSNLGKYTDSVQASDRVVEFDGNSKDRVVKEEDFQGNWNVEVGNPVVPSYAPPLAKMSLSDQAFFLLAFIACTTSAAFMSFVIAAIPTLYAMGRAATSLSKLADTAREELPSTMSAIRLSGMEISDLTLELVDLSREIADGVNKSAQAVQAAEAGIRQIGTRARRQTLSMIEERANLPTISLQPVVAGAARKTSHAVSHATKTLMNIISRGEFSSKNENDNIDRLDI